MHNLAPKLVALLLVAGTIGCGYGRPELRGPGTLEQQRFSATVHDPYADADLGPEVVGARPREFQQPLAEPVRNRFLRDYMYSR